MLKTVPFSINTQFSSIWPIDRDLSGATTSGPSEPGSDNNEGVIHIPQNSSITGASPSDYLVSYQGHSLGRGYLSAEVQLVYSKPQPTGQEKLWIQTNCTLLKKWTCHILFIAEDLGKDIHLKYNFLNL